MHTITQDGSSSGTNGTLHEFSDGVALFKITLVEIAFCN